MKEKVKIIVIIFGMLLLSGINSNAQNYEVGVAAGFDVVNLHLTNSSENSFIYNISPIATCNINGFLSFKNTGFWGFSLEPGIIRKGWNQSFNSNNKKNKIRLYYLQLPVLSDFYISNRIYFSTGPEISYLMSAKNNYGNNYESNTQDIAEYLNRFELSAMAAINFKINEISTVSFRFSQGITEISNNVLWTYSEVEVPDEPRDFNQYFQLLLKMRIKNWR